MNPDSQSRNRMISSPSRSQIARIVFAAAESMGIANRRLVERVTAQVIERLERQQSQNLPPILPGMEDLVIRPQRRQIRLPTDTDILTVVEEILATEERKHAEEEKTEMKRTDTAKSKRQPSPQVKLTENALHVLQKR